jgi:hypothetical protein
MDTNENKRSWTNINENPTRQDDTALDENGNG